MMEFTFEQPAWEAVLQTIRSGSDFSAARFLAIMEEESEEDLYDALARLDQQDVLLDISDLPAYPSNTQTARRLRLEEQLVKEKKLPKGLEENDPLRLYLEELADVCACKDIQMLAGKCADADGEVRNQLANAMLPLVVEKACSYVGKGVVLLDLIQEGSLGLWQSIVQYRGGDFFSICSRDIDKTMAKTIILQARANGVGQKMRQAIEDYRAVDERLLTELGRNPTLEEIALELHMSMEEASVVEEMLDAARMMNRAKAEAAEQPTQPEDDAQAVEDTAYFQMRQRIAELLENLEESDARLLTLRFGLEGGLPLSPEEVGAKLGLTADEVVAREAAALSKLRSK